ncbi:MAG: hypothetical protein JST50_04675 [Bacteroidetes bacterium]|jgi:hypothetical protein|nr:hypothetical protein [Bacteroidota bacterium]
METLNSLSARSLQYFVIAKKWSSDLEFYKIEIKFIRSLLENNYFILQNNGEKDTLKRINNDLMLLDVEKNQLEQALNEQIKQLELMSEDVIPEDATQVAGTQIRLEYMVTDLFSEYKDLKREIFYLVQEASAQNKELGRFAFPN